MCRKRLLGVEYCIVKLELKGTEEIFRHEIPNAEVIGTAMTENELWPLMEAQLPDLVLLDFCLLYTSKYEGDWADDIQHGQGTYFFHTGDRYEVSYLLGECTGAGAVSYTHLDVYKRQSLHLIGWGKYSGTYLTDALMLA